MVETGKFYPPFTDKHATDWHKCDATSAEASASDEATANALLAKRQQDAYDAAKERDIETAKRREAKKTQKRTLEAMDLDNLILTIQTCTTKLRAYGRPTV